MAATRLVALHHQLEGAPAAGSAPLAKLIRPLRTIDNTTNIRWIAREYATLAMVLSLAIGLDLLWTHWGCSWWWRLPVFAAAVVLIGGLQHRLAGLGHEAAHYTLFKSRVANELISDLLCMFPLFSTTHQYRLVHMAHHQYTNDWERDPDLATIGKSKLMDHFPMSRSRFVYNYFVRFFMPHVLFRYLWDVLYLSALGAGRSPYVPEQRRRSIPAATLLGMGYVAVLVTGMAVLQARGERVWMCAAPAAWLAFGLSIVAAMPNSWFFQSPMRCVYSARTTAALRLTYYTLFFCSFGWMRAATGINWSVYFWLLWVLPLLTTFAYFMLLRDVYQHGNADNGKLTNSRVFYNDRFTTWAVWVYGMDMHVPHHLHPAVPHYNLQKLHRLLMENSDEYARQVVECHGTFGNRLGKPSVLDVMSSRTSVLSMPATQPPTDAHQSQTPAA